MKKRPLALVAGLSTALVVAVTGCASTPAAASNTAPKPVNNTVTGAAATTPVQKGGTAVVALPASTNITWYLPITNSQNASEYNTWLITQLYPGLIYINSKYQIDYKDSFANKITYNATGTVYTIDLKKNWKWSDGKPVTAQDVVWDYNLIKATDAPKAPAPWPNYNAGSGDVPDNVKSVVATNSHTVKVTLKKPVNQEWFIYNGLGQITPLPEHAWNKYPKDMTKEITYLGKQATNPKFFTVVDGPFKLQSAIANQSWTLIPNQGFGGHKSTLDKLILQYEASSDSEFAALKTGAVNVGYVDKTLVGSLPSLKKMGYHVRTGTNFGYFDVELNMLKGSPMYKAFNDLKVRQALEMGIDQNTITNAIYHGYAAAQYGPIPFNPKTKFADPKLAKPLYPFNPAKGKKLLESDGWKMQNGVMTKDGQQLKFTLDYASGSETQTQINELMQQDWKKMGVIVDLKPVPFSTLIGLIDNPKAPGKWAAAGSTGITYGGSYPSGEQIFKPGGLDAYGYNNKKENELIAKTTEPAKNAAQTMKNFFAYEEYTAKQLPVLWNNASAAIDASAPNVHNDINQYMNPTTGYPLLNYLWMSK